MRAILKFRMAVYTHNDAIAAAPGGRTRSQKRWPFGARRLAERLVDGGYLTAEPVGAAIASATASGASFVDALLDGEAISEEDLRDAMSEILDLAVAEINADTIADEPIPSFPVDLARTQLIVPIALEPERLVVAIADPTRAAVLRKLSRIVGRPLDLRLATRSDLAEIVRDCFSPRLRIKLPDKTKVWVVLPPGDVKIGRSEHNEIVLHDPQVSTTHAILRGHGTVYQIVDLGSRNGTFVNKERIFEPHVLHHNDKIKIGGMKLKFKWAYPENMVPQPEAEASETEATRDVFGMSPRMRAAWIKFAGRIISRVLGAAALIFLGLAISGGLPKSCSSHAAQHGSASANR